jgi:hypothetical protein
MLAAKNLATPQMLARFYTRRASCEQKIFPKVRGGARDAASDNMRMRSSTVPGST